jgi:hypothetical protein
LGRGRIIERVIEDRHKVGFTLATLANHDEGAALVRADRFYRFEDIAGGGRVRDRSKKISARPHIDGARPTSRARPFWV